MALTVEDGTGLDDADAYVSLAFVLGYAADYGLAEWTAAGVTDPQREVAIRKATEYMDTIYVWNDVPLVADQALGNPTYSAVWPVVKLQYACARLAVFALNNELAPIQTTTSLKAERLKLGDLEKETTYESPSVTMPVFQYVDAMLTGLYSYKRVGGGYGGVYR
jgi:hypothetical protein